MEPGNDKGGEGCVRCTRSREVKKKNAWESAKTPRQKAHNFIFRFGRKCAQNYIPVDTKGAGACVVQAILLLQFFAVASQTVHDRLDRGLEALGSGCWYHAAL